MPLDGATRATLIDLVRSRGYERREEPFTLSSGATSHDYVDCRHVLATGEALRIVAEAVVAAVDVEWDVVGGPTMGADPIAHAVAMVTGRDWLSVRKEAKSYARGALIEGHRLAPGERVLAVEDTVSTGASAIKAIDSITATGAVVVAATTILDRSPVVAARFAAAGIPWIPLLTWVDLGIEPL
jgi:orotate phosphoribosyltransferase